MTVGVALLCYAAILGTLGPIAGRRTGWLARVPRLGSLVLLAAAWSVLAALFLAGLTIALPDTAISSGLSQLLGACIIRLRTAYATPGGAAVAGAGLALSTAIVARIGWATLHVVQERRAERNRHRSLVTLCGRQAHDLDAVILEEARPAAYCLAGRARTVIVTSGTLELLSRPQIAAVLAHEQAHLTARHHRLLAVAAVAGRVFPELPLLHELPREVRHLLEMEADDLAATTHDPETLATALVAVATARAGLAPATATPATLAAADGDTVSRIRRLLIPLETVSSRRRRTVRAAVVAFAAIPVVVALIPAVVAANQPPVRQAPVSTVSSVSSVSPVSVGHAASR